MVVSTYEAYRLEIFPGISMDPKIRFGSLVSSDWSERLFEVFDDGKLRSWEGIPTN
jgi:hypothetical protein